MVVGEGGKVTNEKFERAKFLGKREEVYHLRGTIVNSTLSGELPTSPLVHKS